MKISSRMSPADKSLAPPVNEAAVGVVPLAIILTVSAVIFPMNQAGTHPRWPVSCLILVQYISSCPTCYCKDIAHV